ncbi:MAG: glycoside hydrolase family 28 protein [Bryobacteraceae bacterium]
MYERFRSLFLPALFLVTSASAWSAGPVFNILDYGARNDGSASATGAIRSAIEAAKAVGGGTVFVPAGKYITGPIQLISNLTLNIDSGATMEVQATSELPFWKGRSEGTDATTLMPLISGANLENVAITGRGTIITSQAEWRKLLPPGDGRAGWTDVLRRLNLKQPVPAEDYQKAAPFLVHVFVGFTESKNILIDGIHILGAPGWTVHILYSEKVIIRNVNIETVDIPGRDGIDIDSSRDVIISNCFLDTGDDDICLKSGKDADGRRVNRPTENVTITNCVMHRGHGAVAIGSETSGSIRNVTASNIVCQGTEKGVRIKSARGRGAIMENFRFSNWTMENVGTAIHVTGYYGQGGPEPVSERTPIVRDIGISNMTIKNSPVVISVEGLSELPVSGLRISDVTGTGAIGMRAAHTVGMELHNVQIDAESGPAFLIQDSKDLELDDVSSRKPLPDMPIVRLDHSPGAIVRNSRVFAGTGTFLSVGPGELKTVAQAGNLVSGARKATEETATDYWGMLAPAALTSRSNTEVNGNGTWAATVLTRQGGSNHMIFTFKVEGTKLTGTVSTQGIGTIQPGTEREISDGTISGGNLSFMLISSGRGGEQKTIYKGRIGGDEIQFASQQVPPAGTDSSALGPPVLFKATRGK